MCLPKTNVILNINSITNVNFRQGLILPYTKKIILLQSSKSLKFWGPRFNTGIHLMKQFAHNCYFPCCQCTETYSHVSFTRNNIYAPVPGVSSPVENRFCPELTRCCSQCVILLSWYQSVFDGWVMAEWLRRWLNSGWRGLSLWFWGPRCNTGIHLMKQFAHNWDLNCCQGTETCSQVSFIQNNTQKGLYITKVIHMFM